MIWFRLCSSWITVDDINSRSQEKHVKLSSKLNSIFNHEMSSLFRRSQDFEASQLSLRALSIFSRKVTSKNIPLVSCFVKSNFCWQSTPVPHWHYICQMIGFNLFRLPFWWKIADITPVSKKGNRSEKDNYHLVSILPNLSKVFERCLNKQISPSFDDVFSK